MLSNTCKYAVRAVVYTSVFATEDKKSGIKEIAEKLDIPSPFLGKIMQTLAKQKIVNSTKGPNGGFWLARIAEDISLMEIVEIIDGTDVFELCLIRDCKCSDREPCGIHSSITSVRKELRDSFLNQTMGDLATEYRRDSEKIKI
jgi:Rrf2 family iron-sulfur cluster assembly transcriptional regulator